MSSSNTNEYDALIATLLNAAPDSWPAILDRHSRLVDAGLIAAMEARIRHFKATGAAASLPAVMLRSLAEQLSLYLGIRQPDASGDYDEFVTELIACPEESIDTALERHVALTERSDFVPELWRRGEALARSGQGAAAARCYQVALRLEAPLLLQRMLETVNEHGEGAQDAIFNMLNASKCGVDDLLLQLFEAGIPGMLQSTPAGLRTELAMAVGQFGLIISRYPLERVVSQELALIAYRACVDHAFGRDQTPDEWATTLLNMGGAYVERRRGDRTQNLIEAIGCSERAQTVFTRDRNAHAWAEAQMNIGNAYVERRDGDLTTHAERALTAQRLALDALSRDQYAMSWAKAHVNLGNAYLQRRTGERSDNLKQAITSWLQALEVLTRENSPGLWGVAQMNLGSAYASLSDGALIDNLTQVGLIRVGGHLPKGG